MTRKKSGPGRKPNSGKYDASLPGVPVTKDLKETLIQITEIDNRTLNSVIRNILEKEAPKYLEQLQHEHKLQEQ